MKPSSISLRAACRLPLPPLIVMCALSLATPAAAADVAAAIEKANLYIEVVRTTERARDSWERYASWVNLKTGPTGKERYISYGLYDVPDVAQVTEAARNAAALDPKTPAIDADMKTYLEAYEALAPRLNQASPYYEQEAYKSDGLKLGKALHEKIVPLAEAFVARREALLATLRPFVRDVERMELDDVEKRDGRTRAWHAGNVLSSAQRLIDAFPKQRPEPIGAGEMDEMMRSLGPDTPGETFDQMIAGVKPPKGLVVDMARFDPALKEYAVAVEAFDKFAVEKPEELEDLKDMPRALLAALNALQPPLQKSGGQDFEGSGPLVNAVVQRYFNMFNEANGMTESRIRYLE